MTTPTIKQRAEKAIERCLLLEDEKLIRDLLKEIDRLKYRIQDLVNEPYL